MTDWTFATTVSAVAPDEETAINSLASYLNTKEEKPADPIGLDTNLGKWIRKATRGDIGIELEAEGTLTPIMSTYWKSANDGSLRNGGVEYVLKKPVPHEILGEVLDEFITYSKNNKYNKSIRTSCHVHVNAQPFTFRQIYAVIGAYWLFEDILVEYCGPERVGNLFCLRASDAQAQVASVINSLRRTLKQWEYQFTLDFSPDHSKYSALNLACMRTFGSLEFRSMRGIYTKKEIDQWVNILWSLVNAAKNDGSPIKVYELFKEFSPTELVEHYFGNYSTVIKGIPGWQDSIKKSSMFLAQLAMMEHRANKGEFQRGERPVLRVRKSPLATNTWHSGYSSIHVDASIPVVDDGEQVPTNPWTSYHSATSEQLFGDA